MDDDVKILGINQPKVEGVEKSDDETVFHLKELRGYLRIEQPIGQQRDMMPKKRHDDWFKHERRYGDRERYDRFEHDRRHDDHEKYEEIGRYARGRNYGKHDEDYTRFNPKLNISDFESKMDPYDFLDWWSTIERVFEFCDPPEDKKVKLVPVKLKKHVLFGGII